MLEVAEKRKFEFDMMEEEKVLQEKELEELRQKNCAEALSQKEYQKKQKELKRIRIKAEPKIVSLYEYERLIAVNRTADDLTKREKELAQKERDFASQVQEAVRKRLPKELQSAREDRAYCDEWLPKSRLVDKKEKELLEREDNISWRERNLEDEVDNRAQNLFQELRDNFFEQVREKILDLKNAIMSVLEKLLPKVLCAEIKEPISKVLNNLEKQIVIDNKENITEIDEEVLDI
jgi:hypothetical protein